MTIHSPKTALKMLHAGAKIQSLYGENEKRSGLSHTIIRTDDYGFPLGGRAMKYLLRLGLIEIVGVTKLRCFYGLASRVVHTPIGFFPDP